MGAFAPFFFALTKTHFFYYIYMIILQESSSSQTLKFIPREWTSGATYNIKIRNEMTNKDVYDQDGTITSNLYFKEYSATFSLKQNVTYTLKISNSGGDIIYRDKIFCTNQTPVDYTINDSIFTTNSTANEFITI